MKPDPTDVTRSAIVSHCGTYRYQLARTWDDALPAACFIMLNPSTADAVKDDNTVRRCLSFARAWGCGELVVVNLFAYRATDPAALKTAADPVGPGNDDHIVRAARAAGRVVAAWGVHGTYKGRDAAVAALLAAHSVPLLCLGTTRDGRPRHPLYVRGGTPLVSLPDAAAPERT